METNILGAGPAGLCAAINLARAGKSVKVHEKREGAGMRFCPNLQGLRYLYMPPGEFLRQVGVEAGVEFRYFSRAVICTRGRKMELDCSGGSQMPFVLRGSGGKLGDGTLDAALFSEARRLGVEFEFNSRATERDAQIVATGSRGEPDQAALGSVFENSDFPRDCQLVMFDDRYSPRGWYSYILPLGKDEIEFVTCVSKPHIPLLSQLHAKAMEGRKEISDAVGGRKKIASFGGSASSRIPKSAFVGGKYFVGEAAGFQDPYMGFGIAYALRSGHLAARAMIEGEDYDALWKREFGYYLRKDAAYRFTMWLAGDSAASLVMSKYKDHQRANLSAALPEKNPAYRALVEGVSLLARAKKRASGSW
ncbi:MAG: NAD(P)/FAD-dependent oxidoreductase [Candidatus Micrarchaeia archaeon]